MKSIGSFALAVALVVMAPMAGAGTAAAQQEEYQGVISLAGFGGPTGLANFTLRIQSWTSDAEVSKLLQMLRSDGQRAVENHILDMDVARFQRAGQLSFNFGIARTFDTDAGGRIIRLVTARPMSIGEQIRSPETTDYPFGIIELHLDADGKGNGNVIFGAKIDFKDDGKLEVESYGIPPLHIQSIERRN